MLYFNEYDLGLVFHAFNNDETPNLKRGVHTLRNLMTWANYNSDGWAYWPKPARAANRLIEVINAAHSEHWKGNTVDDITEADLKKALTPIKAFLTRQGVPHEDVIV